MREIEVTTASIKKMLAPMRVSMRLATIQLRGLHQAKDRWANERCLFGPLLDLVTAPERNLSVNSSGHNFSSSISEIMNSVGHSSAATRPRLWPTHWWVTPSLEGAHHRKTAEDLSHLLATTSWAGYLQTPFFFSKSSLHLCFFQANCADIFIGWHNLTP